MHITLCLLTRNELPCLKIIYPLIPSPSQDAGFDEIVAIDGGSTDGTLDFFKENNVPVLGQSKRGRGEAFLLAFENIKTDAFIFFSPDGNEDVKDLAHFKKFLLEGHDVVIASRMMIGAFNEEDVHWFKPRKWANNIFNFMVNILFRKKGPFITDSINGYRAITSKAAKQLGLTASDYTIEYQMTIRSCKHGLKIGEFPTIEGQRVAGDTGAPSFSTGLKFIRRLFAELFN